MRVHPLVLLFLGTIACGGRAWTESGAPTTPPDEQFRTGVEFGYDAWIWHCYEGKRIVITQNSSAFCGASKPRRSSGPCGAPLAAEEHFPRETKHAVPEGYRWPGSPPAPPEPAITDAAAD